MTETPSPLGSKRPVQPDLFLAMPDFSDVPLRDLQETMQRPFFSLAKRKRLKPIDYISPDKSVRVHVSGNPEYGMATIWDADILIYLASHINELRERGDNELSPTIRVQPGDVLRRIEWGLGGRAYERLISALDRLQTTTIKTNIRAETKMREATTSYIDSYTHLVCERTQRSLGMEITISKWVFESMIDPRNMLSITQEYFTIKSGLGRWLYRVSRKHAGGNGAQGFLIGIDTLHQKSGAESSLASFKKKISDLARANALPDIFLELVNEDTTRPRLRMVMRKFLEAEDLTATVVPNESPASTFTPKIEAPFPPPATPPVEYADPAMTGDLLASLTAKLRSPDARPPADPHNPVYRQLAAQTANGQRRNTAKDVLEPSTYAAIHKNFPGWDLDEMMRTFDTFIKEHPSEVPHNYSKRFYGFMRQHHERNKHQR